MTGGGVRSLLFLFVPIILVFIMLKGMTDTANADRNAVRFKLALRDNDKTEMSGTLISQLRDVDIFEELLLVEEGETDEDMLARGCAAVVTVPEDFFYDLYDLQDTDVIIALNGDMPAEASIVRSAMTSLMNILEENQKVYYAAAKVRYGDLTDKAWNEVYHDYSAAALSDTLSRLKLYELEDAYTSEYDSAKLFFGASVLSMLLMFVPLTMLRSVSEELESGLAARFSLTGGSIFEAVLSKFVISLVMTAVPSVVLIIILKLGSFALLAPMLLISFVFSFAFFLLISLLCGNTSAAQLTGNLIMLLVLMLGGALYPASLIPEAFQQVSKYMLPNVLLSSLKYASMQRSIGEILFRLLPLLAAAAVLVLLSLPLLRVRRRRS